MSTTNKHEHPQSGEEPTLEHVVFRGLSPRPSAFTTGCTPPSGSFKKKVMGSLPFLMTGTLATGVIAAPAAMEQPQHSAGGGDPHMGNVDLRPSFADRMHTAALPVANALLSIARPDLPATYSVAEGDTISGIADRFGIPTPAILTLNGLSWNALVHEGQILKLSAEPTKKRASSPARVMNDRYLVQKGETVSEIADRLGISQASLTAHNTLAPDAAIYAGQLIDIPGSVAPVVERETPGIGGFSTEAPTIIAASLPEPTQSDDAGIEGEDIIFDAADLVVADKPALITVRVPEKKPEPVVVEKKPAAATPAPTAPPQQAPAANPVAPPAAQPASGVGEPMTGSITPLNDERRGNAQIIVNVGRELGVSDYGIVIALATAMQESSLRNINWGDRDSVGLYQQRPSSGWGSVEQIMDQAYASRLFFGGPSNPNRGKTRGLLDISGWQSMALTVAAQRVQISAHPDAYAKWEPSAWAWLYELT